MLTKVTITGADDNTNIEDMVHLSEKYPFVEWGILIGSGECERFPSVDWISSLSGRGLQLSLHVCGHQLRMLSQGSFAIKDKMGDLYRMFDRVQLNFHGLTSWDGCGSNILKAMSYDYLSWSPEIIFQADNVNEELVEDCISSFRCSYLFDGSHGAGIAPDKLRTPDSLPYQLPCGWAGGIGEDNIVKTIEEIESFHDKPYWIDMETKVRSESIINGYHFSVLDMKKVENCLTLAKNHIY
jgi:hypothetical protein